MITITWTKGETSGSREFDNERKAERFAEGLRRTGYTVDDAAAPVEEIPVAEKTGRVGHGHAVHVIIEGHAKCGASFRRNHIGHTDRQVHITGEAVTCRAC